jgi:formate hydrogenlyase transcriptional activator
MDTPAIEPAPLNSPDQLLLGQLFDYSPDAIVVCGQDGRIMCVNSQVENLFGYTRDELHGQPVEVLMPVRFHQVHPSHRERYAREPRLRPMGAGFNLLAKRKDGNEFPVDIMLSPVKTSEGLAVIAVIRDISERKRAEEELRLSEERFRVLLEGVKDYAIFMLDLQGRVASWNSGAERIKGYRAEEILGHHFSKFYTAEDIEQGRPDHGLSVAAAQGRFEDEGWRVRKDSSRFWANVIITALRDSSGNLRGFSKVTRDFTERKRAEEALLLEVTNALISNRDIQTLLAAISASIRQVIPHDYSSLALYDPGTDKLRFYLLYAPVLTGAGGKDLNERELVASSAVPVDLTSGEPVLWSRSENDGKRLNAEIVQDWTSRGMKSACWLPLVHRGRALGALIIAGKQDLAFKEKDLSLLTQLANQIAVAVDNAETFRQVAELKDRLVEEKLYLEEELRTEYNFQEIVGESASLKRVLKQVETVAPTDATVLILGETGTGKELIARAIHDLSGRKDHTFVKLNCAAIPSGLLESELFGHEKGAFTGAISQKIGRLELAHRGTLFLDEVGDIPLELQPKLLRALQEKEFERLGSTRTIPVDARLIAATNRDLAQMVKDRQFRGDLYYRLRVFPVSVPSLRDRHEDIPLLVHHFVQKHARRMGKQIQTIPPESMQALERWQWPGNVRELENLIERAVILSRGPVLRVPVSELSLTDKPVETPLTELSTLESAEREHILRILRESGGVIAGSKGAAARLGLKRTTLNFKMKKLGITRKDF